MQRIMVDLPEPDGPQMTMRSPRLTVRLISRSTWNSPYHLCMPAISIATSLVVVCMRGTDVGRGPGVACVAASLIFPPINSAPVALGEARLGVSRVTGHAVAEDEIED